MTTVSKALRLVIASDQSVVRVVQAAAYIGAIALLLSGFFATTKFASSPFEIFTGVTLSGILAMTMIMLGMMLPVATAHGSQRATN